jgi:3',5'-cyclic AMP phosphodiesterase CpdA
VSAGCAKEEQLLEWLEIAASRGLTTFADSTHLNVTVPLKQRDPYDIKTMQSMLLMFEVVAFAVLAVLVVTTAKLAFKEDGTFRILHISDVHYEIPANGTNGPCQNVSLAQLPCNEKNASSFLSWLIEKEEPDLIVFTGDIIDWATDPAKEGMTEYYEIASQYNVPWAASLGNHDDNSPSMKNRSEVLEFVESLPGTLTEMGPVSGTYGNFILEIFAAQTDANPVFRTYHFDSTTHIASIQKDQVDWYKEQSAALNAVQATPALAFYHIPLTEYAIAMLEKKPYSGNHNEKIQPQPLNTGLFDAFIEQQDVKAGFCGHDHIK